MARPAAVKKKGTFIINDICQHKFVWPPTGLGVDFKQFFVFSIQVAVLKTAIKKVLGKKLLASSNHECFISNQTAVVSSVLGPRKQSLLSWECHMLSPAIWLGWLHTVSVLGLKLLLHTPGICFSDLLFGISSPKPKTWKLHLAPPQRWWEEKHWLTKLFWWMGRFKILCFWLKIQRGDPPSLSVLLS